MKKNFFVYKFMKKNFSTWLNTEGLNTKKFTVHYACMQEYRFEFDTGCGNA